MQEELDKVKKYPKGINGWVEDWVKKKRILFREGRSDYEKEEAIPTFGESETERDKEICTVWIITYFSRPLKCSKNVKSEKV